MELLAKQRLEATDARKILKKIKIYPSYDNSKYFEGLAWALRRKDENAFFDQLTDFPSDEDFSRRLSKSARERPLVEMLMSGSKKALSAAIKLQAGDPNLERYFAAIHTAISLAVRYIRGDGAPAGQSFNEIEDVMYLKEFPKFFDTDELSGLRGRLRKLYDKKPPRKISF